MESKKRDRSEEANESEQTTSSNNDAQLMSRATAFFEAHSVFANPSGDMLVHRLWVALQPHLQKAHLEVELRLCILCDERSQRIRLPIESPAVVSRVKCADASVSKRDFDRVQQLLTSTWACHVPNSGGAAVVRNSHTRDLVRNGVRESTEVATGNPLGCVKKQRLAICDISCPRHKYDLRFAVNQEVPVFDKSESDRGFSREKKRTSFVAGPFCFDVTEVTSGSQTLYEVEVEGTLPTICRGSSDDRHEAAEHLRRVVAWLSTLVSNAMTLLQEIGGV